MAKFPPEILTELRDRVRLEDWVGRTVRLERQGHRWVGLCPFHAEKTPSFGVSADKQLFHCFGCGVGGDLFDYVMRIEGLDFPSAVRLLAGASGLTLPEDRPPDPEARRREEHRDRLHEAHALAQEVFRSALERTPRALAYLREERGLSRETVERFELGWAPPEWSYLSERLERAGVAFEIAEEAGLVGRSARSGQPYDRFRGRVTFPIRLPGGRIAGFGARRADWIEAEGPKYLNSPESPIYEKSKILYGLDLARDEIRKRRRALLVEGYLDVILLAQAGFTNVVAGCGTALTDAHARALARLTKDVVTLYDGDLAGRKATHRAAELLLAAGLDVQVVALPEGSDPDDYVRAHGAQAVETLLDAAPSAIDYFLARGRQVASGAGVAGTQRAMEAVRPLLTAIPDPLARDVAIAACARELGIDSGTLRRHLGAKRAPSTQEPQPHLSHPAGAPTLIGAPRPSVVEIELLKMLLESPQTVLPALESRGALRAFTSEPIREVVRAARARLDADQPIGGPEALELLRAHGLTDERWIAEIRGRLIGDEGAERHALPELIQRLVDQARAERLRSLRDRLARCTDIDEQTRLLEEVRRVHAGEL